MKIPENKTAILKNIKIAHRGLWNEKYPENSLGAFKRCIDKKIPIEFDVHLLRDSSLIVFHDNNLKRMTGIDKPLKKQTLNDIENLKLKGTEYKIPTLIEVLNLIDGKVIIDIEIKTDVKSFKICKKISHILDKYNGPFFIKSFNPLYIMWFRIFRPNYIRGILVSKFNSSKYNIFKFMCYKMYFNFLCKPDFIAFNCTNLPNSKIDKLHNKGIPIILWTKKENQLLELQYDGYIYEE